MDKEPRQGMAQEGAAESELLSRRQAVRKIGTRAAMVGVAAWVTPSVIVGTQTEAGALSGNPGGGGGGGGGNPGGGGGGNPGGGGGNPGGGSTSPGGGTTTGTTPFDSGTGAKTASPATAPGSLAFTGANIDRDLATGGGLVVGGWLLHKLSKSKEQGEPDPGTSPT